MLRLQYGCKQSAPATVLRLYHSVSMVSLHLVTMIKNLCSCGFLLLADKHTYDTSLEVSEEFGSAIKSSLTTLEPVGKFLRPIWPLALFSSHAARFNLVFKWLTPPQNDTPPWFFIYLSQRKMRWCVQRIPFSFTVLHFTEKKEYSLPCVRH